LNYEKINDATNNDKKFKKKKKKKKKYFRVCFAAGRAGAGS
jgi:hypothetical protein